MWIIPKNHKLHQEYFPSVLDTEESKSVLEECLEKSPNSLMWRSKPTPLRTWLQRWKRVKWFRLLCGRILKPSLQNSFEEKLTSLLEAIPASPSVMQAIGKEPKILDTFGRLYETISAQLNLFPVSSKMSGDTSAWDMEKFTETYEVWATGLRQDSLQRRKLAHLTRENDCSSLQWRTPSAQESGISVDRLDGEIGKRMYDKETGRNAQYGLSQQVNWPTPKTTDAKGKRRLILKNGKYYALRQKSNHIFGPNLNDLVEGGLQGQEKNNMTGKNPGQWGTPRVTTNGGISCGESTGRGSRIEDMVGPSGSRLNASWVEQLMGIPVGLTQLPTEWID